jgi:hypothetical protein
MITLRSAAALAIAERLATRLQGKMLAAWGCGQQLPGNASAEMGDGCACRDNN